MRRIFISYAHIDPDRQIAQRLYRDLAAAGLSPWMDEVDLQPGEDWTWRIAREIRECQYFLALFSSVSLNKRGYAQRELRLALEVLDSIPINDRFVIPIRLTECRPADERIARLQRVDFFPAYEHGLKRLLRSLRAPERGAGRLYIDVGIEIPKDIGAWHDDRLFPYIAAVLVPEARQRALRDYEGVSVRNPQSAISARTEEKLEEAAKLHGFVEGWRRYRTARFDKDKAT